MDYTSGSITIIALVIGAAVCQYSPQPNFHPDPAQGYRAPSDVPPPVTNHSEQQFRYGNSLPEGPVVQYGPPADPNNSSAAMKYPGLPSLGNVKQHYRVCGIPGTQAADGSWSGMIRSLIDGKCDIAAADLAVTAAREAVVDFSLPYHQYELQMVVGKQGTPNGQGYTYYVQKHAEVNFLKHSSNPRFREIWHNVTKNFPHAYVDSDKDGIDKVLSGYNALIMESSGAKAALQASNGQLEISSEVFPATFYALAVPQGSPIRDRLSWGIATLRENGQLQDMIKRHFTQ